jgi:hypothetical protein
MADSETPGGCNHLLIGTLIIGLVFLIYFTQAEGFRSSDEKLNVAGKLLAMTVKPGYDSARRLGLDGAEFYQVRQLWNKNKFTAGNIAGVL